MGREDYVALLRMNRENVLELQKEFPEVGYEWLHGMTQKEISKKFGLGDYFGVSEKIATFIVRHALRGIFDDGKTDEVEGLLERGLYDPIALHRKNKNLVNDGSRGFASLSEGAVREVSLSGVLGAGRVPKKDEEWKMCYSLFRSGAGTWKDIAALVNDELHEGKPIRTANSVRKMSDNYRKGNGLS